MGSLFDLSAEVAGISATLSGLSIQIVNDDIDRLTPKSIEEALYGLCRHLDRISSDLEEMSVVKDKTTLIDGIVA